MLIIMIEQIEGVTYVDIEFLLFLQKIRESAPEWFNNLIQSITDTAGGLLIIFIPLIIFFCIDKKKGEYIWISLSLASLINVFVKCVFCVYRPWIRSELIKPTEKAIEGAGDYSFPSSHTQGSASAFGSVSFLYRKKKMLSIMCIFVVLLVAFSRNYLGVHTPQDVLAGLLIAVAGIALTSFIWKKIEGSDKNRMTFYWISVAVIMLALIFVRLKKYPIDFDAVGNILYDPMRSISSFASKAGLSIGFLTAWMLEEKYIAFSTDNLSFMRRIVRAILGIVLYFISAVLAAGISALLPISWLSAFIQNAIMYFIVIFFTPLIFLKLESRLQKRRDLGTSKHDASVTQ